MVMHLTCMHGDICAWQTDARPSGGEDIHHVGASTDQPFCSALHFCGITVHRLVHSSGDYGGVFVCRN